MLGLGVAAILSSRPEWLVYVVCLLFIVTGVWVWLAQPGTLLYATRDQIGHRTILLTRYEVPRSTVVALEVGHLSVEGSPLATIVFVDEEGRPLLRSFSTNYRTADLELFAHYAGVDLRL
jgi:type IV secretory pathway protease TraF